MLLKAKGATKNLATQGKENKTKQKIIYNPAAVIILWPLNLCADIVFEKPKVFT